jgi:hypothetical protein
MQADIRSVYKIQFGKPLGNKDKAVPLHATEGLGERRYISYSFTTSALDGGEWSPSLPGRVLDPGKGPPIPIVQEAGWAPEPVWTQRLDEKFFRLCRGSNLDHPVVQPVGDIQAETNDRIWNYSVEVCRKCTGCEDAERIL